MNTSTDRSIDWHSWLQRWDAQQAGYLPNREERFAAMLDALEVLLPADFVALDLACGPGAISQRILARFPAAQCIALDWDPVLLALGQHVLGTDNGRLRWVEADLRQPTWAEQLGVTQVDAVLSTTALHWLTGPELVQVYGQLGRLVRPGGVLLNGDHMAFGRGMPSFARIARFLDARANADAFERQAGEDWQQWWANIAAEPALAELLAERQRRFPHTHGDEESPIYDVHVASLRDADFAEVGTIWQSGENRVLLAVR